MDNEDLNIYEKDIYFEETIEKKIHRIEEIKCTHYVDDLEKILDKLNDKIIKIQYISHFEKKDNLKKYFNYLISWGDFENLIKSTI